MDLTLLKEYLDLLLSEQANARVPQQLVSKSNSVKSAKSTKKDDKDRLDQKQNVDEFSGVGAIMGYMAPLGASADDVNANKRKNSYEKKSKKT
jgi:hypothetical protein